MARTAEMTSDGKYNVATKWQHSRPSMSRFGPNLGCEGEVKPQQPVPILGQPCA